jgi:hypothetical protein
MLAMKPPKTNAFLRSPGRPQYARKGLAALLAPLRAAVEPTEFGATLALEPMHAVDALRPWQRLDPDHRCTVLVIGEVGVMPGPVIPVLDRFAPDCVAMDDLSFGELVTTRGMNGLCAVLVDGPLDAGDAAAIGGAVRRGASPLPADLRAVAALRVTGDRTVHVDLRTPAQAVPFVAENLRLYLAALSRRRWDDIALPEDRLVEELLARTGSLSVRPIETEVYSTFVDVGVGTGRGGEPTPADAALIYDVPGNGWHGE